MFVIDAVDESKATGGVWYEYEGSEFLIARFDNANMRSRFEQMKKPYKRKIDRGEGGEVLEDIMLKAMSETVLLDWKDVSDAAGNPVAFDKDSAYRALKGSKRLRDAITSFATEEENYFKDALEK